MIALFFFMSCLAGNAMAEENKTVYGYVEKATLVDKNLTLSAKLDTGAKSASLNAININDLEIDGVPYIRFTVPSPNGPVVFQSKYLGQVKIKTRSGEAKAGAFDTGPIKRPIVLLTIKLGNETRKIRVNLTNRKQFNYPLLLGRDAIIEFGGIIDPSRAFVSTSSKAASKK